MPGTAITTIILGEEQFILSALRAVFWPKERLLILADMHLGKTGHFRTHGIPIPNKVMYDDLERLDLLIDRFTPEALVIVGDMFHHKFNKDIREFQKWRNRHTQLPIRLVPGNHDVYLGTALADMGIVQTAEEYRVGAISFMHEMPASLKNERIISGHLHPGYSLKGKARQAVHLPCFIHSPRYLILPAFSKFTGLFNGYPRETDQVFYAMSEDKLFKFL